MSLVFSADNYGNGVIAADLNRRSASVAGQIGVIYFDVDFFVTRINALRPSKKTMSEKLS
jgi:ribose transport system substrate-binding protein